MTLADLVLVGSFQFARTLIGLVVTPYETYRKLTARASLPEIAPIALLVSIYFSWAVLLRTPVIAPLFLTRQFFTLFSVALVTHFIISTFLWFFGKRLGGVGEFASVAVGWSYTLVPTVCWFLFTSLMYLLLPPPRTTSWAGIAFSIAYLLVSATLFWWKLMLGYLTLRFGLKLDLRRIALIMSITIPLMGVYSIAMYRLGLFRVPFL